MLKGGTSVFKITTSWAESMYIEFSTQFWLSFFEICDPKRKNKKTEQILFPFSSDKHRRTDSLIRRKTAQNCLLKNKNSLTVPVMASLLGGQCVRQEFLRPWVRSWAGLLCFFFDWSGCQFFYLCRSWKVRVFVQGWSRQERVFWRKLNFSSNQSILWRMFQPWNG